ncbi:MAG: hypothetical protein VB674_09330 [Vicinamibacterales bacterium]
MNSLLNIIVQLAQATSSLPMGGVFRFTHRGVTGHIVLFLLMTVRSNSVERSVLSGYTHEATKVGYVTATLHTIY